MASQSRLLMLPRELRDQIIGHVFDDFKQELIAFDHQHTTLQRATTPPCAGLPAICRVSEQLYYETTPDFLSRITPTLCNVETICWMRKWLATFPDGSGYRAIRQLAFRNFHGPEQIKGYELIALCPNLRQLNIMFGDGFANPSTIPSLAISSLNSACNAYESLDSIIVMHQLHKLMETPKLEQLDFGFHDWEQPFTTDRARQVMGWLRVKSQAMGRTVHISCKQMRSASVLDDDAIARCCDDWY